MHIGQRHSKLEVYVSINKCQKRQKKKREKDRNMILRYSNSHNVPHNAKKYI